MTSEGLLDVFRNVRIGGAQRSPVKNACLYSFEPRQSPLGAMRSGGADDHTT